MVRAYLPQRRNIPVSVNSNFPPQNSSPGSQNLLVLMQYEDGTVMRYEDGTKMEFD